MQRLEKAKQYNPSAPLPLQKLRHYYEMFRPWATPWYFSSFSVFTWVFYYNRNYSSHVQYKARAAYTPDAVTTVNR